MIVTKYISNNSKYTGLTNAIITRKVQESNIFSHKMKLRNIFQLIISNSTYQDNRFKRRSSKFVCYDPDINITITTIFLNMKWINQWKIVQFSLYTFLILPGRLIKETFSWVTYSYRTNFAFSEYRRYT